MIYNRPNLDPTAVSNNSSQTETSTNLALNPCFVTNISFNYYLEPRARSKIVSHEKSAKKRVEKIDSVAAADTPCHRTRQRFLEVIKRKNSTGKFPTEDNSVSTEGIVLCGNAYGQKVDSQSNKLREYSGKSNKILYSKLDKAEQSTSVQNSVNLNNLTLATSGMGQDNIADMSLETSFYDNVRPNRIQTTSSPPQTSGLGAPRTNTAENSCGRGGPRPKRGVGGGILYRERTFPASEKALGCGGGPRLTAPKVVFGILEAAKNRPLKKSPAMFQIKSLEESSTVKYSETKSATTRSTKIADLKSKFFEDNPPGTSRSKSFHVASEIKLTTPSSNSYKSNFSPQGSVSQSETYSGISRTNDWKLPLQTEPDLTYRIPTCDQFSPKVPPPGSIKLKLATEISEGSNRIKNPFNKAGYIPVIPLSRSQTSLVNSIITSRYPSLRAPIIGGTLGSDKKTNIIPHPPESSLSARDLKSFQDTSANTGFRNHHQSRTPSDLSHFKLATAQDNQSYFKLPAHLGPTNSVPITSLTRSKTTLVDNILTSRRRSPVPPGIAALRTGTNSSHNLDSQIEALMQLARSLAPSRADYPEGPLDDVDKSISRISPPKCTQGNLSQVGKSVTATVSTPRKPPRCGKFLAPALENSKSDTTGVMPITRPCFNCKETSVETTSISEFHSFLNKSVETYYKTSSADQGVNMSFDASHNCFATESRTTPASTANGFHQRDIYSFPNTAGPAVTATVTASTTTMSTSTSTNHRMVSLNQSEVSLINTDRSATAEMKSEQHSDALIDDIITPEIYRDMTIPGGIFENGISNRSDSLFAPIELEIPYSRSHSLPSLSSDDERSVHFITPMCNSKSSYDFHDCQRKPKDLRVRWKDELMYPNSLASSSGPMDQPEFRRSLRQARKRARDLQCEVRALRKTAQNNAQSSNAIVRDAFHRIKFILNTNKQLQVLAQQSQNSTLMTPALMERSWVDREQCRYQQTMDILERSAIDLEGEVESLRQKVVNGQRRLRVAEVERFIDALSQVGRTAAELKCGFPDFQNRLKDVMGSEMEKVVREERFLKEEPDRMESVMRRCKKLTNTMVTMKKLAYVQDPTVSLGPLAGNGPIDQNEQNGLLKSRSGSHLPGSTVPYSPRSPSAVPFTNGTLSGFGTSRNRNDQAGSTYDSSGAAVRAHLNRSPGGRIFSGARLSTVPANIAVSPDSNVDTLDGILDELRMVAKPTSYPLASGSGRDRQNRSLSIERPSSAAAGTNAASAYDKILRQQQDLYHTYLSQRNLAASPLVNDTHDPLRALAQIGSSGQGSMNSSSVPSPIPPKMFATQLSSPPAFNGYPEANQVASYRHDIERQTAENSFQTVDSQYNNDTSGQQEQYIHQQQQHQNQQHLQQQHEQQHEQQQQKLLEQEQQRQQQLQQQQATEQTQSSRSSKSPGPGFAARMFEAAKFFGTNSGDQNKSPSSEPAAKVATSHQSTTTTSTYVSQSMEQHGTISPSVTSRLQATASPPPAKGGLVNGLGRSRSNTPSSVTSEPVRHPNHREFGSSQRDDSLPRRLVPPPPPPRSSSRQGMNRVSPMIFEGVPTDGRPLSPRQYYQSSDTLMTSGSSGTPTAGTEESEDLDTLRARFIADYQQLFRRQQTALAAAEAKTGAKILDTTFDKLTPDIANFEKLKAANDEHYANFSNYNTDVGNSLGVTGGFASKARGHSQTPTPSVQTNELGGPDDLSNGSAGSAFRSASSSESVNSQEFVAAGMNGMEAPMRPPPPRY